MRSYFYAFFNVSTRSQKYEVKHCCVFFWSLAMSWLGQILITESSSPYHPVVWESLSTTGGWGIGMRSGTENLSEFWIPFGIFYFYFGEERLHVLVRSL